ncbi:Barrel-sandwich domain of CusB or HlyD membrane-fusion [uncultured archaeon]|nr:Barrel-sandwich domain of CusB or HlyD membrane-fusion [uncultured archaeon]
MATQQGISKVRSIVQHEEKKLASEIKQEEKAAGWFFKSHTFRLILLILVFSVLVFGTLYLSNSSKMIYIEKSEVYAPTISLSSASSGVLQKIFVKEGDSVSEDMMVAQVDGNPVRTKVDGLVIYVQNTPGQIVNAQVPIVKMINPNELSVIGHIQEDKGLKDIRVGQKAIFTVDAFDSKKYEGVVDSISPTSRSSDIVFSISDKRQEQEFDVKVKFDVNAYPELKNGMSAKMWVYK